MKRGFHWWFCTIMIGACIIYMIGMAVMIADVAINYPTHS